MDSNQDLQDFPNTTKPQSSVKGGTMQNSKNIRKNKNSKLWKKYLQDLKKSMLTSQSKSQEKEESVYNLRNLFETPNNFSGKDSSHHTIKVELHNIPLPLFPEIDKTEEMERFKNSNTKLQVFNGTSNQKERIKPTTEPNTQEVSKSVGVSASELLECGRVSTFSGLNNPSINVEIYGLPKAHEAKPEDLLKSKSSHSVVMVDFRIINQKDPEIIEISDDDEDDESDIQQASSVAYKIENDNARKNFAQVCQQSINNSLPKKVLKNISAPYHETSKSFSDFTAGCNLSKTLKSPEDRGNLSINMTMSNLPQTKKTPHKNQLKSKSENVLNFHNKMNQTNNEVNYPNINLKIYNTSSTQVDESEDQLNSQTENIDSAQIEADAIVNDNVQKEVLVSKDFTQNISEIAKNVMQSIQGVIFKTCCNSPSSDNLCKSETKTEQNKINSSTSGPNMHFHIKLKIYNQQLQSTPSEAEKLCDKKFDIKIEDFKLNESERNKALNITNRIQSLESKILKTKPTLNESTEKPAKESNTPVQCSKYPKMSKRLTHVVAKKNFSSSRQSQLKLYQLKVQVEQRRLELLDLKLAREWEEIQRDIILFERSLLPEKFKIRPLDCDGDDVEV